MKLPLSIVVVALFFIHSIHAAEVPPELAAAKARYQTALASGNKSAKEDYLQQLQKLKGIAKTKKKPALGEAVDAEIKALNMAAKASALPYGKSVPGMPGFVTSPYEPYKGYIDVKGISAGKEVICPFSMKPFLVPEVGK